MNPPATPGVFALRHVAPALTGWGRIPTGSVPVVPISQTSKQGATHAIL